MNIRQILFKADMVRALLDGSKTQTRRPMKIQPPSDKHQLAMLIDSTCSDDRKHRYKNHWIVCDGLNVIDSDKRYFNNPFGDVGDLLYVRETACIPPRLWADCTPSCISDDDGYCRHVVYRADSDGETTEAMEDFKLKWTPSIHMPRWASRLTLEITDIRVERVQDISTSDIKAEGIKQRFPRVNDQLTPKILQGQFIELWNSIYKNWNDNPWVWVTEFEVIQANVDEYLKTKAA